MTSIEIVLADHLAHAAALLGASSDATRAAAATLLGVQINDEVYTAKLPQQPTLPALRVALFIDPMDYRLDGEADIQMTEVQVDAYADATQSDVDTYDQANTIAGAVFDLLSGYVGTLGSTSPTVNCLACFRTTRRAVDEEADELRLVRVLQVFRIWFRA